MPNEPNDSGHWLKQLADGLEYLTPQELAELDHLLTAPPNIREALAEAIRATPLSVKLKIIEALDTHRTGGTCAKLPQDLKVRIVDALNTGVWPGEPDPPPS